MYKDRLVTAKLENLAAHFPCVVISGARQVGTLFNELERINKKYGVISMCIGTGMGAAGIFERE